MAEPALAVTRLAGSSHAPGLLVVGPSLGTSVEPLWRGVADRLAGGFEILGWDLPGHGRSGPVTKSFGLDDLASVLRRATEDAAGTRPAFYAGVSLGGAVALELALEPGVFAAVACFAGAGRFGDPAAWRERAAVVRRHGTSAMLAGSSRRWFAPGFAEREPAIANRLLRALSDADAGSYAYACEALAAFDVQARLADATVPLLVAPGERDTVITPRHAWESAASLVTGAAFHVFTGCGHLPPAEDPEAVAGVLTDTFAKEATR